METPGRTPFRAATAALVPYNAGLSAEHVRRRYGVAEVVKLASNENPFGASPAVAASLAAGLGRVALYTAPHCTALPTPIADRLAGRCWRFGLPVRRQPGKRELPDPLQLEPDAERHALEGHRRVQMHQGFQCCQGLADARVDHGHPPRVPAPTGPGSPLPGERRGDVFRLYNAPGLGHPASGIDAVLDATKQVLHLASAHLGPGIVERHGPTQPDLR